MPGASGECMGGEDRKAEGDEEKGHEERWTRSQNRMRLVSLDADDIGKAIFFFFENLLLASNCC